MGRPRKFGTVNWLTSGCAGGAEQHEQNEQLQCRERARTAILFASGLAVKPASRALVKMLQIRRAR